MSTESIAQEAIRESRVIHVKKGSTLVKIYRVKNRGKILKTREADGASKRYLQDIRSRLGRFAKAFAMDIASVETVAIDEWLRSLKVSARSRKNFRILLVALFNFTKNCGFLPRESITTADTLPIPKVDEGEVRWTGAVRGADPALSEGKHAERTVLNKP